MNPVLLYARKLQLGEVPPETPGNAVPLYVNSSGQLMVSVEGVSIELPGGGVNINSPIGPAGGVRVESIPGSPLQVALATAPGAPMEVAFVTAQDVKITSPLGANGGIKVEAATPAGLPVSFSSPQQVTFPSAQPVTFATAPELTFPSSLIDPFSRLRTSNPFTLFDSKFLGDKRSAAWGEILTGNATSIAGAHLSLVRLTVGTATGDRAVRQSYYYMPYQPGKGRLVFLTGVISYSPKANCVSRIGLFDSSTDKTAANDIGGDGTFFEMNGTTMFCVVRSYAGGTQAEERFAQSTWNVDKMDGTGPSGVNLDWSKSQIFVIDLEWLGVGTVTFGFMHNRKLIVAHQVHHDNLIAGVYMRKPDLPLRYEIENVGPTSGSTILGQICCSVISEGGYEPVGLPRSANFGITTGVVQTTETPLCSIRLRPSFNRSTVRLADIQLELDTSDTVLIRVYTGLITLTGAVWTDVDTATSIVQFDRAATAFTGTPILRYSGYVSVSQRRFAWPGGIPLQPVTDIQGTPYPILITGQNQPAGGTANLYAAMTWNEYP